MAEQDIANARGTSVGATAAADHRTGFDDDDVVAHAARAVKTARIIETPFPHAIVDTVLPPAFYEAVAAAFPSPEGRANPFNVVKERRKFGPGEVDTYSDRRMSVTAGHTAPEVLAELDPVLHQLFRVMADIRLGRTMLGRFGPTVVTMGKALVRSFGYDDQKYRFTFKTGVELIYDRTGFSLAPHTDGSMKAVTTLIYVPIPGGPDTLGTHLYSPRSPEAARENHRSGRASLPIEDAVDHGAAPYQANTMLMFARTERSFHGVPPDSAVAARRLIQTSVGFADLVPLRPDGNGSG